MKARRRPSPGSGRLNPQAAARMAWALWAVAMVSTLSAVALLVVTRSVRPANDPWQLGLLTDLAFLAYPTVGLIIAARRPHNPLGWLLLLFGLILGVNELLRYYAEYTLTYEPGALPVGWRSAGSPPGSGRSSFWSCRLCFCCFPMAGCRRIAGVRWLGRLV